MQAEYKTQGLNKMQNNFPLLDHHSKGIPITQQVKKSPPAASPQALQGHNMQKPHPPLVRRHFSQPPDRKTATTAPLLLQTPQVKSNMCPDGSLEKMLDLPGAQMCPVMRGSLSTWDSLAPINSRCWHLQPRALSQALQCVRIKEVYGKELPNTGPGNKTEPGHKSKVTPQKQ